MLLKRITAIFLTVIFVMSSFCCLTAKAATFNADVDTKCKAIYLLNIDTDTLVYEKDSSKKVFPASTTKIMTYIVSVEHIKDLKGTKITVEKDVLDRLIGTGSSLSGLEYFVGQSVTAYDLLNCLMIKSGNDAAMLLAYYIGEGSIQTFVDMMNDKAETLGCKNTHFMNPHGLHDKDHYTTAEDLAIMTRYAQTLPEFNDITNRVSAYISVDKAKEYPLVTTNYMIDEIRGGNYYYEYAKGVKTGTTDEAGYCLVSTATKGGYTYLCVALGAASVDNNGKEIEDNGAMQDSKALYEWAFENLELKNVINEQTPVCEIPVSLAWNQDTLQLIPEGSFSAILPKDVEASSIDISADIPGSVTAPVIEGNKIGTATVSYANQKLTEVNLIAAETVERSKILYFLDTAKKIIQSKWMILAVSILVFLLIIYIIIALMYNISRDKKRKNRKKNKSSRK